MAGKRRVKANVFIKPSAEPRLRELCWSGKTKDEIQRQQALKNGAGLLDDDDRQASAKFTLPSRHSRNVTHATLTRVRRSF